METCFLSAGAPVAFSRDKKKAERPGGLQNNWIYCDADNEFMHITQKKKTERPSKRIESGFKFRIPRGIGAMKRPPV